MSKLRATAILVCACVCFLIGVAYACPYFSISIWPWVKYTPPGESIDFTANTDTGSESVSTWEWSWPSEISVSGVSESSTYSTITVSADVYGKYTFSVDAESVSGQTDWDYAHVYVFVGDIKDSTSDSILLSDLRNSGMYVDYELLPSDYWYANENGGVVLAILDSGGTTVRTFSDLYRYSGQVVGVHWDGKNDSGTDVAPGTYTAELTVTKKDEDSEYGSNRSHTDTYTIEVLDDAAVEITLPTSSPAYVERSVGLALTCETSGGAGSNADWTARLQPSGDYQSSYFSATPALNTSFSAGQCGTYDVRASYTQGGATATDSIEVVVFDIEISQPSGTTVTIEAGETIDFATTLLGPTGGIYSWSPSGAFDNPGNSPTATFNETDPGTYPAVVSYQLGGATANSETFTVIVEQAAPSVQISATATCVAVDDSTVSLTCTTEGGDGTQPAWSILGDPPGASISATQGNATTFTASSHGMYSVEVNYSGATDSVVITVIDVTIDSPTGSSSVEVADPLQAACSPWPTPGGSVEWALGSFQGQGTPQVTFSPSYTDEDPMFSASRAGTYTLVVTFTYDAVSISRESAAFSVNVPTVTITTPPTTIELGDTLGLACTTSSGGSGAFAWSAELNGMAVDPIVFSGATTATPVFTPMVTGTYTVTVSYTKGDETVTDSVLVTVNSLSVDLAVILPTDFGGTVNHGESITLECSPSSTDGTLTWSFSPSEHAAFVPSDPTDQTQAAFSATPDQLTTYTVTVTYTKTNSLVSTSTSDSVDVQVNPFTVRIIKPSESPAFVYKGDPLDVECEVQGQAGGTVTWLPTPSAGVTITPDGSNPYAADFTATACGEYELEVQYSVGGATGGDGPVTIIVWEADIDMDSDRTGDVEGSPAEEDLELSQWAVVPVNCDDDDNGSDRDFEDAEINGAEDAEDLVPIVVRQADPTWEIRVYNTDAGNFNIFRWTDTNEDGQWDEGETASMSSGDVIPAQELSAGDVQLLIEATKFPLNDDTYTLTLTAQKAGEPSRSDELEARPSPFLLLPATCGASEVFVVDELSSGDDPFVTALKGAVTNVTDVPVGDTNGDVWMQDEMEIGFTSWPGPGGTLRFMHVVLNLPRNGDLDAWVQGRLAPNVGYTDHLECQFAGTDIMGGDIEVIPGAGTHGVGAVIVGEDSQPIEDFIKAQGLQTITDQGGTPGIVVSGTSWLQTGHIDEIVSFLGGTSVAVTDWDAARVILEDMNKTCTGTGTGSAAGVNALTVSGSPAADTGDYQEGAASVDTTSGYLYIADADLDSDFPLKDGNTNKDFSVSFWMNAPWGRTISSGGIIYGKGGAYGQYSLAIGFWEPSGAGSGKIRVCTGVYGGTNHDTMTANKTIQRNQWYHVAVTYQDYGTGGSVKVRIYDPSDGSVTDTEDWAFESINVEAGDVKIGAYRYSSQRYVGHIDELVVFNDVLTATEIDQVRQGTYDLDSDPHCAALWRFEDGALTLDSNGGEGIVSSTVLQCDGADLIAEDWIDGFIEITSGAALGQVRQITGVVHDTQANTTTITVSRPWDAGAEPGSGSAFELVARSAYRAMFASGAEECGVATGGSATELYDSTKSWNGEYNASDPYYSYVMIVEGPGEGDFYRIGSSQGQTITLDQGHGVNEWSQNPTDRSRYVIVERSKVVSAGNAMFRWPEGQDSHYDHPAMFTVVRQFLLDTANIDYQDDCQDSVDVIKQQVNVVLGSASFTLVPAIYKQWPSLRAVSWMPDMVNLLNTGGSYIIAEPFVSQTDTAFNDRFKAWSSGGTYIDDWYFYHTGRGEVHCGTNAVRAPDDGMKAWWDEN